MSLVEFEEDQYSRPDYTQDSQQGGLIGFLISHNIAKDIKQANYILIAVGVIAITISLFLLFGGNKKTPIQPPQMGRIQNI